MQQSTQTAVQAVTSAILAGDNLREALARMKTDFFRLSRRELQRVIDWAESEYSEGVKS